MSIKKMTKIGLTLGVIIVIVIFYITVNKLEVNQTSAQQYDFPLQAAEIEKVLNEQKIDWHITDNSVVDESRNIFTLKNDKKITMGIDAYVREGYKVLSMTWFLPSSLTSDEVNNFFKSDLNNHLELPGIFYGNKKALDKALSEMLNYYLDENNYNKNLDWNKRVENDHIKVQIKPMHSNSGNQIITLLIMPSELYEDYLKTTNNLWKNSAAENDIKILNSTVEEMIEAAKSNTPPANEADIFSKHFIVRGILENIKENKKTPEKLINMKSSFLKPNKEKYLSANLVDETGNINVFIEMTSLTYDELSLKRNHNIMLLYNNNEPVYIVRSSVLNTEE